MLSPLYIFLEWQAAGGGLSPESEPESAEREESVSAGASISVGVRVSVCRRQSAPAGAGHRDRAAEQCVQCLGPHTSDDTSDDIIIMITITIMITIITTITGWSWTQGQSI